MSSFKDLRHIVMACLMLVGSLSTSANATTISYNLSGDINEFFEFTTVNPTSGRTIYGGNQPLIDVVTGSRQLTGFTLSVGDVINGTVTLDGPFTVPAADLSSGFSVSLFHISNNSTVLQTSSLSFFKDGVPVTMPLGFYDFTTNVGGLGFGKVSVRNASPSITFDTFIFGGTITGILDQNNVAISSVALTPVNTALIYNVYDNVAPTPLPAAGWLLFSGLGGLGVFARKNCARRGVDRS